MARERNFTRPAWSAGSLRYERQNRLEMFSSECRDSLGITLFDRLTWREAVQGA